MESAKLRDPDVVGMSSLNGVSGKMGKLAGERFGVVLGLFSRFPRRVKSW